MGITHSTATDVRPEKIHSRDVDAFPVPTGREEEWRFTPLDRLRGLHDGTHGSFDGKVVVETELAPEVRYEVVPMSDPRVGSALTPDERPSALAMTASPDAIVLTIPADTLVEAPSVVTLRGEGGLSAGHVVVDVKPFAKALVVIDHVGSSVRTDNVEVLVGDGASVTVVSLQDWDAGSVHLTRQHARVGRDARYRSVVVTFGGDVVRVVPTVEYAGPGGDAELFGLYFADSGQHLEHRLLVDHAVAHCKSRVAYKGALQGSEAHTVWIGDVIIRAAAEGTDTYELNRNLVLSDGARADSVPNLEIETGEIVGAGHASATGRFDDEQLFYLQTRGITEQEARRLVVHGFFAEILAYVGIDEIQARLAARLEIELAAHR